MEKVRLARSALQVSKIGLGLSRIHKIPTSSQRNHLIDCALDLGISHFDTARVYGDGISEAILGKALRERRKNVTICTKFGLLPNSVIGAMDQFGVPLRLLRTLLRKTKIIPVCREAYDVKTFQQSLEASLRALKTDYIDILCIHEPGNADKISAELIEAMKAQKTKGLIRFIGAAGSNLQAIASKFDKDIDIYQTNETGWSERSLIPDFSYRIFSEVKNGRKPEELLKKALRRRPNGAVIIGTNKESHLKNLVEWSQEI